MNLRVSIDSASLDRVRDRLSPARVGVASRRALNDTLRNLRTELTKRIGQDLALKAATIKASMRDGRARGTDLEASLAVRFDPISLREYSHSMSKRRGLSVRVKRGEGRKRISGGFIGTTIGGSLYQRVPGAPKRRVEKAKGRGTNQGRMKQPISKMHGPSVRAVAEPIVAELHSTGWIAERLQHNLDRAINHALGPAKAPPTGGEA